MSKSNHVKIAADLLYTAEAPFNDRPSYLTWRADWRRQYRELSEHIREVKRELKKDQRENGGAQQARFQLMRVEARDQAFSMLAQREASKRHAAALQLQTRAAHVATTQEAA